MNQLAKLLLPWLLTAFCAVGLHAESFLTSRRLTSDNPAIQGVIYDVIQDHEGFIWFSTFNGLHRYDGTDIVHYKPSSGSAASAMPNRINVVRENSQGDIWCWGNNLYLFGRRTEEFTDLSSVMAQYPLSADDKPLDVNCDLCPGSSVLYFSRDLQIRLSDTDPLHDHSRWEGPWVSRVRPTRALLDSLLGNYEPYREIQADEALIVRADQQGNYWLRRSTSLDCITPHHTPFHLADTPDQSEVRCLMTDHRNRSWSGTKGGEVMVCDTAGQVLYLTPDGRLVARRTSFGSRAYAFCETRDHCLWIGTREDGLYRLEPTDSDRRFRPTHYLHDPQNAYSLASNEIFSLLEDSRGQLWVGTFGHGVNLFRNGLFFHHGNRLAADARRYPIHVRQICEIGADTLVACCQEGLFTWSADFARAEDICFYASVKRGMEQDISDIDVMQFFRNRQGTAYAVTRSNGLCRLLSDNLLQDNLRFESIGTEDGLFSDATLSLAEDARGRLWLSSYNSISCLDHDNIHTFGGQYFSRTLRFSECLPIVWQGELVYGTENGWLYFRPELVEKDHRPCQVVFTNLTVENQAARNRLGNDSLIVLAPDERNLSLSFAGLNYADPSAIRYSYWLEGVDRDWIQTEQTTITYLNLPPGRHVFHLKSTNADGVWNSSDKRLAIQVTPTFLQSTLGHIVLALVFLLLVALCVWIYQRFFQLRHHLDVEREMTDIKLRFFTDVSHELRTPLTLIEGPVSEVLDDQGIQGASRRHLESIQKNTRHMLTLVNQILDFRKLQNNKMTLIIEYLPIEQVLRSVMENFDGLAEEHRIAFTLQTLRRPETGPEGPMLWVDRDKVEKIGFNLLSNAFKYTPDGRSITVVMEELEQEVAICVSDEGRGMDSGQTERLFKRFETIAADNLHQPSSGIGLSLVKQFAELHHGRVEVQSEPNQGSHFTVHLPKGRNHFQDDDNVQLLAQDQQPEAPMQLETPSSDDAAAEPESGEKPIVLVVEDNAELRGFIREILQPDYQILEAADGVEGLEKARQYWPSLILSDVMMPQMDGFQLVEAIRGDIDIYAVPMVLLTAKSQIDDRVKGMDLGADDYIIKPFSSKYLKARVRNLLLQQQRFKRRLLQQMETSDGTVADLSGGENAQHLSAADQFFMQDLQSFVEKNIDNPDLSINDFAKGLCMGRTRFTKKIKQLFDLTPVMFVQTMRIQRARQLLSDPGLNVSDVAYRTGFNDPKYFTRCFKKYYGITPREFASHRSGQ